MFDIRDELFANYMRETPKTIKILDIHSLLCFALVLVVKGTYFLNPGISQFANDATFLMALGSMIMTGNL